MFSKYK